MVKPRSTPRAMKAYERDAVNVKRVLVTGAIVVATVVVSSLAAAWLSRGLTEWYGRGPSSPQALRPPPVEGPALQPRPTLDLEALRAEKRLKLHQYRWLDRSKGVVQIPIDDAIRILVERNAAPDNSK